MLVTQQLSLIRFTSSVLPKLRYMIFKIPDWTQSGIVKWHKNSFWKHCGQKEKMLLRSICSFTHNFFFYFSKTISTKSSRLMCRLQMRSSLICRKITGLRWLKTVILVSSLKLAASWYLHGTESIVCGKQLLLFPQCFFHESFLFLICQRLLSNQS